VYLYTPRENVFAFSIFAQITNSDNIGSPLDSKKFQGGTLSGGYMISNENFEDESFFYENFEAGDLDPKMKVCVAHRPSASSLSHHASFCHQSILAFF
jgi:hypothetical protein